MVDGRTGFIMLDKNGNPKVALHITPHVFRHTFCTNYANSGMDIKNLQYLMGHSDAGVTLNVYTHASYAHASEQMAQIARFRQHSESEKNGDLTEV